MKYNRKINFLTGIMALCVAAFSWPCVAFGKEGKASAETDQTNIRAARFAGSFYPENKEKLREYIRKMTSGVSHESEGKICGAVAPHAGYVYSGSVAAHTHKMLAKADFDTIIIIGHDTFQNVAALIAPHDYFETPLGKAPVDTNMAQRLVNAHKDIVFSASAYARDHTIEVQLPFLQELKKDFKIVPVLFGTPSKENIETLADAIMKVSVNRNTLTLASTDLSHYPPHKTASVVDKSTIKAMESLDVEKLLLHLSKQERKPYPGLQTAMCARGGVCAAMRVARKKGADRTQFLQYATSGDSPERGSKSVVGYCSVLFVSARQNPETEKGD